MSTKKNYLILAHELGYTLKRWWLLRAFSIPTPTPLTGVTGVTEENKKPGFFYYDDKGKARYISKAGEDLAIDDHTPGEPLYGVKEDVSLSAGDFQIVKEPTKTKYSILYLNLIVLEYPFGDSIPYQNTRFSGKLLDGLIVAAIKDKTITITQYREYTKSLGFISALSNIIVPAASKRSIIPPPGLQAKKKELLEKYKDRLDEPVIVAKIEKELLALYEDYLKDDPSAGFFIKSKSMTVNMARNHVMFGAEKRLDDSSKMDLSTRSLREGWEIDELPKMVNSLRMGSYNRSKSTALGGEAAKFSSRIYQNTRLSSVDCKSVVGLPVTITPLNVKSFNGRYVVDKGTSTLVTQAKLDASINKVLYFRSPQTCNAPDGDYCPICMGDQVANSGAGLGTQASGVGSVMLDVSMAATHDSSLSLARYDYASSIL